MTKNFYCIACGAVALTVDNEFYHNLNLVCNKCMTENQLIQQLSAQHACMHRWVEGYDGGSICKECGKKTF